jgi:hypothetical protein
MEKRNPVLENLMLKEKGQKGKWDGVKNPNAMETGKVL